MVVEEFLTEIPVEYVKLNIANETLFLLIQ